MIAYVPHHRIPTLLLAFAVSVAASPAAPPPTFLLLEEFPDAAAAIQDAMAEELARLTEGLERVRQQLIAIDGEESPLERPEE